MGKKKIKPNYRRRVLRLPDLDHCNAAVLDSGWSQFVSTVAREWSRKPSDSVQQLTARKTGTVLKFGTELPRRGRHYTGQEKSCN
jgi:hypothetical protein